VTGQFWRVDAEEADPLRAATQRVTIDRTTVPERLGRASTIHQNRPNANERAKNGGATQYGGDSPGGGNTGAVPKPGGAGKRW
jgi:hypothetical protein